MPGRRLLGKQRVILENLRMKPQRDAAEREGPGLEGGLGMGSVLGGKPDQLRYAEDRDAKDKQAPKHENQRGAAPG